MIAHIKTIGTLLGIVAGTAATIYTIDNYPWALVAFLGTVGFGTVYALVHSHFKHNP